MCLVQAQWIPPSTLEKASFLPISKLISIFLHSKYPCTSLIPPHMYIICA